MQKTAAKYEKYIFERAAEGVKAAEIYQKVVDLATQQGWNDCPSERSVQRLYSKWKNLPDDVRRQFGLFRWPDSMDLRLLPWEAGRTGLDLVRLRVEEGRQRPTVQEVRWFWQLRLASPSLPLRHADWWASLLSSLEFIARQNDKPVSVEPSIESMLAFEPWANEVGARLYGQVAARDHLSGYSEGLFAASMPRDREALHRFHASRFGEEAAEELMKIQDQTWAEMDRLGKQAKTGTGDRQ